MAAKKASTNKCKFDVGEKVLCYETDRKKKKVLYHAKVLKLVPVKDKHGNESYKYLVHFMGWNSKWDSYVTDELLLKDTEENRKLQTKIAEEAQLTPGHLCKKEQKQGCRRCVGKSVNTDSEDSADETCVGNNEDIPIPINDLNLLPKRRLPDFAFTEELKHHLGYSCHLIHDKNYLVKVPCQPNVVTLFENYLKFFARSDFSYNIKPKRGRRQVFDDRQIGIRYNICIEVLDGLRICFNEFFFSELIVNEKEEIQYNEAIKMSIEPPVPNIENGDRLDLQNNVHNGNEMDNPEQIIPDNSSSIVSSVMSQISQSACQLSNCSLTKSACQEITKNTFKTVCNEYVLKADQWKAVPDSQYYKEIKEPAIIYGVNHLLRLFEKLPIILKDSNANDEKLTNIYNVCNGLLKYLSSQGHLFEIKHFVSAAKEEEKPTKRVTQKPVRSNRNKKR